MEWPVLASWIGAELPPAVLAVGVVSLLNDVSSQLPSGVLMSGDRSLVATTTFVGGHSYARGSFTTETLIRCNGMNLGNIESWKAKVDGRPLRSVDRNFWGVTFAKNDDTFYVTPASVASSWLMRGSIKEKSMVSLRTDAECQSLSPGQSRIAHKKRVDSKAPGAWRLAVLDLRTGHASLLAEPRSVGDHAEWLDNNRLPDGLPRPGSEATTSDVWAVPADGTGAPNVFLPEASSPAKVVR